MLSILIPTYNYNVVPLVLELQKQAVNLQINYEIIVQDDLSQKFIIENSAINSLPNCCFFVNIENLGRGKNINLLCSKAKYDYVLIMDCDTFPTKNNFIHEYFSKINDKEKIIFGGITYQKEKPENNQLLRWIYGIARESSTVKKRSSNPNSNALTSNLLIRKDIFLSNKFDNSITKYGYEDLVFLCELKKKGIIVTHINNQTYHLGLETSLQFLNKTKIALENLKIIHKKYSICRTESKILVIFDKLKKLNLTSLLSFLFIKTETIITENLLSQKPSLVLFDWYKLGYFCKINSEN